MLRSHRSEFIALGIVALFVVLVGAWSWPKFPSLDSYSYGGPRNADYHPGGEACQPAAIAAIRDQRAASEKAVACQKEAEEYRQNSDDLIQQTRAADAAQAQTDIASQSLWMAWFQTLGGILTLAAAGAAAWYARDAAREAQRGSNAAEGQLLLADRATAADLRPYLFVDRLELVERHSLPSSETNEDGTPIPGYLSGRIIIHFRNFGRVPARNIHVFTKEYLGRRFEGRFWQYSSGGVDIPICAPNHERKTFASLVIPAPDRPEFDRGWLSKIIRLRFTFEDDAGRSYTERDARILYGSDLETFYLLTDTRVAEMRSWASEPEFDWDIEAEDNGDEEA